MATIRATCPACGNVELISRDVRISLPAVGEGGSYFFSCPMCKAPVSKPAEPRVVDLLVSAGVGVIPIPEQEVGEGSINPDEILTLHEVLQGELTLNDMLRVNGDRK